MKKNFWDQRIPTLFGILLITLGVGITTFLVNQGVLFKSNASLTNQPQNVRITNIIDSAFTVSYETESRVIGSLNYGEDQKLGKSALDDRDQQTGSLTSYNIHNITVRNLSPQKKYFFSINSGQEAYINSNQPFEVTTGLNISESPPSQDPISGKILLSDGTTPKEAIVYVTADNSQVISTLAKPDGSYILPLNSLRTNDLSSYYTFSGNGNVKMLVFGDSLTSNVLLSLEQTRPIPTIILSKDYDFRQSQSPVAPVTGNLASFPSFTSTSSAVQIITPRNNQTLTDQQPIFKGTSAPEQNVKIVIHSDQAIQTTVKADQNGNWSYRPPSNLSPGTHTITIQALDTSGILKTITQSFVVYASGQQINPPPSGTPTPTPSPSPTKIPTPTIPLVVITKTPVPTATAIPTIAIPSITTIPSVITPIQTQGGFIISPTIKPLPPTGNPSIMTAGIVGAVVTLVGGLLFLLTRGGMAL
jgi:hypothetical protein